MKNDINQFSDFFWVIYSRQRNLCLSFLRKMRGAYFSKHELKAYVMRKEPGNQLIPCFPRNLPKKLISLIIEGYITSDDRELANIFNSFLVTRNLKVQREEKNHCRMSYNSDLILTSEKRINTTLISFLSLDKKMYETTKNPFIFF